MNSTKYRCPVISIKGERILEKEEIRPLTIWESFTEDFMTYAGIHGGMIEPVMEDLKKKYKIKRKS